MTAPPASRTIYLDHQASTPLDARVRAAMEPWLDAAGAANPHSTTHRPGWRAAEAIEAARGHVAALLGARPGEIVFTSGGTEANNLALFGACGADRAIVASAIEHPSVLACLPELARRGHEAREIAVDGAGRVDAQALAAALAGGPALVSVMWANNEIGCIQDMPAIAALCRAHGALLHSDAVQAASTLAIDVAAAEVDLLTVTAHKMYGPQGIGALWVREGVALTPLLFGGAQQGGRRPGTLPVALCVGFGEACRIAAAEREGEAARLRRLKERLFEGLREAVPDVHRNDPADGALPGCLSVSIAGLAAADFLLDLPDIAASTGSACSSGSGAPSHVLTAIGLGPETAHGTIRFGLGRWTTEAEIDHCVARLGEALRARGV